MADDGWRSAGKRVSENLFDIYTRLAMTTGDFSCSDLDGVSCFARLVPSTFPFLLACQFAPNISSPLDLRRKFVFFKCRLCRCVLPIIVPAFRFPILPKHFEYQEPGHKHDHLRPTV